MANDLTNLRKKRGQIIGAITHLRNTVAAYKNLTPKLRVPEKLHIAAEALKTKFLGFEEIQDNIEDLDVNEAEKRFEVEGSYYDVLGEVTAIVSPLPRVRDTVDDNSNREITPSTTASLFALMRLPELDMTKFDGEYENYPPFIDAFTTSIDQHPELSKVQKLQYFRSLLTGKAAKVIEALPNTAENYETALEMIEKKYNCERKILTRHWWILQDIPVITKETPESIGNLVDSINQHVRALQNLNQPVDQWDLPLICLIQSKISAETYTLWELNIKDSKLPTYTSLLEFLEHRSQCSSRISTSKKEHSSNYRRGRQTFISTGTKCPVCADDHRIAKCPRFKVLSTSERYKFAKDASLCINCLGTNHQKEQCISRFDCVHCHERHHTLLHFKDTPSASNSTNKPPAKRTVKMNSSGMGSQT